MTDLNGGRRGGAKSPRPSKSSARGDALTSTRRRFEDASGASRPSSLVTLNRVTNMARRPGDGSCKTYARARLAIRPESRRDQEIRTRGRARGSAEQLRQPSSSERSRMSISRRDATAKRNRKQTRPRNREIWAAPRPRPAFRRHREVRLRHCAGDAGAFEIGRVMVRSLESAVPCTSLVANRRRPPSSFWGAHWPFWRRQASAATTRL